MTELPVPPASDVTTKVAVLAAAGTVTEAGTVALLGLPLVSVTTAPPPGAGPPRVTVPVEVAPRRRLVGLRATE
jgi:hypothetical protein